MIFFWECSISFFPGFREQRVLWFALTETSIVLLESISVVFAFDFKRGRSEGKNYKKSEERKNGDCIDLECAWMFSFRY
jgi:hypothetical protein